MNLSNFERAHVLTQALPYIKKYAGKTVVIKYGGNAMISPELKAQVIEDLVLLWTIGVKIVLVHGGGPEINELSKKLGKEATWVNGLRVTDEETVDIAQMVLSGKINKHLVNLLQTQGGNAIGISGVDGKLIEAEMKDPALGYVGKITKINPGAVQDLLDLGYLPVISTIGRDKKGNLYNINADTAASSIAAALNAKRLVLLTDINGILRDKNDPTSIIEEMTVKEAIDLCSSDIISGGMIPKLECAIHAVEGGVYKTTIIDGRVPHSIVMELLTNEGAGTLIKGDIQ